MNICLQRKRSSSHHNPGDRPPDQPAEMEPTHIPEFVARQPQQNQPAFSWHAQIVQNQPRRDVQGGEGATGSRKPDRARFDPRRVAAACRSVLRTTGQSDSGTHEWESDESDGESMVGGGRCELGEAARPAEPWWRMQICSQMEHARLEAMERQRRQCIATVLSDNEHHRRITEQAAYVMEDLQERVRRREFAKIVLDEEQHTRIREDQLAFAHDQANRSRRRRWAVKAIREEEARVTMVRPACVSHVCTRVCRNIFTRVSAHCTCVMCRHDFVKGHILTPSACVVVVDARLHRSVWSCERSSRDARTLTRNTRECWWSVAITGRTLCDAIERWYWLVSSSTFNIFVLSNRLVL